LLIRLLLRVVVRPLETTNHMFRRKYFVIDSMAQSLSSEAQSHKSSQEIPRLL